MTEYTNGIDSESPHELERMAARIAGDGEIHDLIGTTVQNTVSQYHSLLQKGLEQEVDRILREFRSATADMEHVVTQRVKSRLQDIVRQEVQRIFDTALSSSNESIFGALEKPTADEESRYAGLDQPVSPEDSAEPVAERQTTSKPNEAISHEVHYEPKRDDIALENKRFLTSVSESEGHKEVNVLEAISETGTQTEMEDESHRKPEQPEEADDLPTWTPFGLNIDAPVADDKGSDEQESKEEDEVFEGTVRLNVEANDCIGEVVHFVRELRQKPQLRLLRMVGNNKDGVDIWLGLREPLHLKRMLPEIEGVSISGKAEERDETSSERVLSVKLEPRATQEEVPAPVEA